MESNEIINKVANSALVTFDLEQLYQPGDRALIDIKDQLYQELVLREKDFRNFIKENDWSVYQDKYVAVTCSTDAIVPTWAYMLLSVSLQPYAKQVIFGTLEDLEKINWAQYQNAKIVIKGCSKVQVPVSAYMDAVNYLRPVAASIMYGEPCSTIPLFKKTKS